MQIMKEQVPLAMAAGRASLGRVIIAGEGCGWSPMALAWLVVALCVLAVPANAIGPGAVAYINGTAPVAKNTIGSFDTTSPTTLHFQYKQADGTAGQIGIEYTKIYGVEPSEEAVHRLGLLPWIAVSLVAHPETRYLVTIRYADADGTAQIGVFEVARQDQHVVVEILNARSTRGCGARTYPCPATLERR
jgi:hypothetical protein